MAFVRQSLTAGASAFSVEAVGDTLEKTTFRSLRRGASVNIERALRADGRFGGHIVMGHVTGTARVISWGPQQAAASAHGATGTGGAAVSAGAEDGAWFLVLELNPSWLDRVAPERLDRRGWRKPHGRRENRPECPIVHHSAHAPFKPLPSLTAIFAR